MTAKKIQFLALKALNKHPVSSREWRVAKVMHRVEISKYGAVMIFDKKNVHVGTLIDWEEGDGRLIWARFT